MIKKRTTIYLDQDLAKILKLRTIHTDQSVSDYISRVVAQDMAEEQQDLKDLKAILKEPTISFEKMLKELKIDNDI